jgi:uncharacterized protein
MSSAARRFFLAIGFAALLVSPPLCLPASAQTGPQDFEKTTLVIRTSTGDHRFTVEIARTPRQQSQGLMFRKRMAADAGMLFVHATPRQARMWMKNTYIPLDMLFVAADGRITKIVERTTPHSLETIASDGPVSAVLELNAGTAARLGIRTGDRLLHPVFGSGS